MTIHTVALIGANGTLGPSILSALRPCSSLKTSVLNRATSKSTYDPAIPILTIPDDLNTAALTAALRGQDALVISIAGSYVAEQKRLIEAAFHAGVKRVIPAEFGSCDSADDATNELLPLMQGKKDVREYLDEWCSKEREGVGKMTWTSLVTGHLWDYGLSTALLKFDVQNRKAWLLDGGDIPFSGTNLDTIGLAVVKILTAKEDETKNKLLYVHSFCTTQSDILKSLEKATNSKFSVQHVSSKELIEEARPKMLAGDKDALEEVVSVHGIVKSDWRGKKGFANELLELPREDLDEVVLRVVREVDGDGSR